MGDSSDSDIVPLYHPRPQKHLVLSSDDRRAQEPAPKQIRRAVAPGDDDDDDDGATPAPPATVAQTAVSSTAPSAPSMVPQAAAAPSTTQTAPLVTGQASTSAQTGPTPTTFLTLAQVQSPLQVLPERPFVVAPCTNFGAHPRNQPGEAPTFIDMTNLPPPSERLSTLMWMARDLAEVHAEGLDPEAVASHIARNAAPTADVGSLPVTPEASDDEEDDDDHDDSEEDEQTSDASAGPSASTATPANPLGFDGRTSDKFNATIFLNAGRPTWKVKRTLNGWPFQVLLGFGCRIEHVPGPMPRLRKRPCKMTMRWTPKFPEDRKSELLALAAEEFDAWKPLLGTFAAISNEKEKERVQAYVDQINDAWHYNAKKAECQVKVAAGTGNPGLQVREREASQRVWGRVDDTPTRAFYDGRACLPGLDLEASFEQLKRVYNWLAAASPYWSVINDTGLHTVTELVAKEYIWLQQRDQPRSFAAILASIDARIGPGKIGIFTLYQFDLIDNTLGHLAQNALIHEAGAKGCPLSGVRCARGSHIDRLAYRNPRLKVVTLADGTQLSLGFPVNRLGLLPCSEMASPCLAWDSTVLLLNKTLRPSQRAKEMANGLFDKGVEGVFTAEDFLSRPLPTSGIKMARLPDGDNRWLAAFLHVLGHHSPASTLTATTAAADAASLALAPNLLRDYDDLIIDKVPSLFQFKGVVNERVALIRRASEVVRANQPSPDRVSSRHVNGDKRNYLEEEMWWTSGWFNHMKASDPCVRAELGVVLMIRNLFVDDSRLPPHIANLLRQETAALKERFACSSDKSSTDRLFPPAATAALADFVFAGDADNVDVNGDDDEEELNIKVEDDDEEELNIKVEDDDEEELNIKVEDDDDHFKREDHDDDDEGGSEGEHSVDGDAGGAGKGKKAGAGNDDRFFATMRRKPQFGIIDIDEVKARSPSLKCLNSLVDSLPPRQKAKLQNAPKMRKTGLPTLGWFPTSFDYDDLHHELANWIAYEEEGCEQYLPLKPPPAGPLDDKWQADEASQHFKRSLEVGMSPANLYGSLLMMYGDDELEECHISGLSLRDPRIARTIMGHRVHGLGYSSGFITRSPTDCTQYRPSSRNFIVEVKMVNWARSSYDGATFLNNLYNAVPWLLDNLEQIFSADVAAAITPQLEEILADDRLMPARATKKMDPWTLVNKLDLTKSRVFWKRLGGYGDLEETQRKVEKARARAERDGDIERLQEVLPLSEDWSNEGKRKMRDARNAKIAVAAATFVPAALSRSRVPEGKSLAEHQRRATK